ncbi:hypothetical protein TNCV_760741 [Trichonephila clavipes]|nr:hypothetical protein TNCV_760741 [Trichonephila clavipes]
MEGTIDDRERWLRRCVRSNSRATIEHLTTQMNQKSYKKCLPKDSSVNVAVLGPPKLMPGSCTYVNYCLSAMKAGICTPVPQMDVH